MAKHKEPRTWVYMVKPRFVDKVKRKEKDRTIRAERKDKRRPAPGDYVSIREWTGKPRRSKQRVVFEGIVSRVSSVLIHRLRMSVNSKALDWIGRYTLSLKDGFSNFDELAKFIQETHDLPFKGVMIEWVERWMDGGQSA